MSTDSISKLAFGFADAFSMKKQAVDKILSCNEGSAERGLIITMQQAEALVKTSRAALEKNGRIEFGSGVVDKIISAFYTSDYISPDNYEETLHELVSIFYEFKNETCDVVSDDELIGFMRIYFDGCCHGSAELLASSVLVQLSLHIRSGKPFKAFRYKA